MGPQEGHQCTCRSQERAGVLPLLLPREDTRSHLTRAQLCWLLIWLGRSAARTGRNEFLLFIWLPSDATLLERPKWTRTANEEMERVRFIENVSVNGEQAPTQAVCLQTLRSGGLCPTASRWSTIYDGDLGSYTKHTLLPRCVFSFRQRCCSSFEAESSAPHQTGGMP